MRQTLFCCTLLAATSMFAQQGQPPPTTTPPYQTPPTFPEGQKAPPTQMPPDTHAPPPDTMSDQNVEGKILNQLNAEPSLSGTNIDARVDENSVVLSGSVDTVQQHDVAIRIAQSNAGDRRIVDKIKVKERV